MRYAALSDAASIELLANYCFGDAYIFPDETEEYILDPENRFFVEEDEKGITGAVLFLKDDKKSLHENMEVDEEDYERISGGKKVLHHKFSIVREDVRGQGLMSRLLKESIDSVSAEGEFGAIFTQGWIKNGEVPMESIFDRVGYIPYKRQIRPWWKYADRTCNVCKGRCKCDAMVYYRKL